MKLILTFIALSMAFDLSSQDQSDLPFAEIPEYPQSYSAGTVSARLIDGLGFRYYWATEGLRETDLMHKPSDQARSMEETLDHLYGLSLTIANAPQQLVNQRPADWPEMSFEEKRARTLENFHKARTLLISADNQDIEASQIIFKRGENQYDFPFWNLINGPIADAIWHTGQVVLMRRTAGNPINSKVNVFMGKLND